MQQEIKEWIQKVLNETLGSSPDEELYSILRDGIILCRLMNTIKPGSITKEPSKTTVAFKMMEHVSWFTQACSEYGVPFVFLPGMLSEL
jgi:hypothetical protein